MAERVNREKKGKTPYTKALELPPNPEQMQITVMVIGHGTCFKSMTDNPDVMIDALHNIKTYSRADVGQDSYGSADPTDSENARQTLLICKKSAIMCPIIPSILADINSKSRQSPFGSRDPIPERYEFGEIDANSALTTVPDFYNPVSIGIGPIQMDIKKLIPPSLLSHCSQLIPFDAFGGIFNIANCNSTLESQSGKKVISRAKSVLPDNFTYGFDYTNINSYPVNMQRVILKYIELWNIYVNSISTTHPNSNIKKFYTIVLTPDSSKIIRITNVSLYHIVCITISKDNLSLAFSLTTFPEELTTSLYKFKTLLSQICSSSNIQLNIISLTCRGLVGGKKRKNIYNKMKTRQIRRHRRPPNKKQRKTKRK